MASSSMPAKPMPSDPMPIAPVPTMPPMIAVDPVPSVPPMPSLPAPTVPVPAFPALATTSTSPDQALVVIEFVPILVQPTNDPLDSTADCEESVEETPDPESCTDAVDVPLFQTLSVPMPVAPAPSAPIPVEPIPSAPMPVEPVPSAPVPVEPVPVAPVLSAPVPVAPVPSAPMPSEPIPIVPMPATPSSQAPLLPPIVTPVYQNIVTIENSVSPSEEGPITFTYTEIITDDTTTDNLTIPYCEDEIPPPYSATVPTDAPMVTLPEPIPATVPAVPAPMPTTVPAVPAPMPTTVPAVPAVPAPSSEIDSASENGATCTPEFLTVTIYDDIQIDPVTVTEYVPYFIPVDTNMWTYLLPTPPLAPGPVIWTGAPPSLVPELSTAGQPEIPAPSSAPAVPVAPCSTSSWIRT
ncbi:hypothetical protein GGI20_002608 [Coemansia sp. BCRC 34301]|nr:hypothetical protein GGI20_002608 [Coemansia sp. BCRC 34301]